MTRNQALQLLAAIEELVAAEIADSWKEGGHPADIPKIETNAAAARKLVAQLITNQLK